MMKLKIKDSFIVGVLLIAIYAFLYLTIMNEGVFSYKAGIYINILIAILFAVSLNITVGLMGQLNLGFAGFISIGAYTGAVITRAMSNVNINDNIKLVIALIAAGIVAGIFGVIVSALTLRLKGDYLAIITLAFGEMVRYVIQNIDFLGGAAGFKNIPIITNFTNTYIVTIISLIIIIRLMTSGYGRLVLSIREDEIASENIGINTNMVKIYGFFISSFFAGVAGVLFAHNLGVLSPDKFSFVYSIEILVMVVFGGIGSITGSIVSASFITIINELLRQVSEYRVLIYSVVLIMIMIFRPEGLLGTSELTLKKIKEKIRKCYWK
ncbi:branched-chain amino acid ABC transporter permease [Sneathia vaginalis]|uniref:ABC transporter permease n=1 Tax=Sneathia vaginalis TaxID=187101 RepID=A0A0E3ZB90_9FUSO|nr:branched-chain amino acid ABC transporter permease [Sneathia vaginalis]AKC95331.1 ABC transporter permease [Sneathia vaginalis]